jgi:hypothetical protein
MACTVGNVDVSVIFLRIKTFSNVPLTHLYFDYINENETVPPYLQHLKLFVPFHNHKLNKH